MVQTFQTENKQLTITLEEKNDVVILAWSGKSTSMYPDDFLAPIFQKALALDKPIIMNFLKLEYLISTTLKPIFMLLETVKNGKGKIELQYDAKVDWQRMTFTAFEFYTDCERIKITGI